MRILAKGRIRGEAKLGITATPVKVNKLSHNLSEFYKTKPSKQNLPRQTYQIKSTKPNLPNQPTKPNLPNQTYQTKPTKPNPPNKTSRTNKIYQSKSTKRKLTQSNSAKLSLKYLLSINTPKNESTPGFVVHVAMFWINVWNISACTDCNLYKTGLRGVAGLRGYGGYRICPQQTHIFFGIDNNFWRKM